MLWNVLVKEVLFMSSFNHFTMDDRNIIQTALNNNESFKSIASQIKHHCTAVSKEILRNRTQKNSYAAGRFPNRCIHRTSCSKTHLCSGCYKKCSRCRSVKCNTKCADYKEDVCINIQKAPYVCNGCKKISSCALMKYFYSAPNAHKKYRESLISSRCGISISDEEIKTLDNIISPLLKQGHSIYSILQNNKDTIMYSDKTIYKLIDLGLLTAKNIDLPKKVGRKIRKNKSIDYKVDKKCRQGRTYNDYLNYISEHPDSLVVEMDSVIGRIGGKSILTIHFKTQSLMIGYLRERNDSASVIHFFDYLYEQLGEQIFQSLFQIILTDNGSEFSNPSEIEKYGCRIFYCNGGRPNQKGSCEKNHEEFRKICPKGTNFDNFTQSDINLVFTHVNSYVRKKLNGKSPIFAFSQIYETALLDLFNITELPPYEVILKPSLIHKIGE